MTRKLEAGRTEIGKYRGLDHNGIPHNFTVYYGNALSPMINNQIGHIPPEFIVDDVSYNTEEEAKETVDKKLGRKATEKEYRELITKKNKYMEMLEDFLNEPENEDYEIPTMNEIKDAELLCIAREQAYAKKIDLEKTENTLQFDSIMNTEVVDEESEASNGIEASNDSVEVDREKDKTTAQEDNLDGKTDTSNNTNEVDTEQISSASEIMDSDPEVEEVVEETKEDWTDEDYVNKQLNLVMEKTSCKYPVAIYLDEATDIKYMVGYYLAGSNQYEIFANADTDHAHKLNYSKLYPNSLFADIEEYLVDELADKEQVKKLWVNEELIQMADNNAIKIHEKNAELKAKEDARKKEEENKRLALEEEKKKLEEERKQLEEQEKARLEEEANKFSWNKKDMVEAKLNHIKEEQGLDNIVAVYDDNETIDVVSYNSSTNTYFLLKNVNNNTGEEKEHIDFEEGKQFDVVDNDITTSIRPNTQLVWRSGSAILSANHEIRKIELEKQRKKYWDEMKEKQAPSNDTKSVVRSQEDTQELIAQSPAKKRKLKIIPIILGVLLLGSLVGNYYQYKHREDAISNTPIEYSEVNINGTTYQIPTADIDVKNGESKMMIYGFMTTNKDGEISNQAIPLGEFDLNK